MPLPYFTYCNIVWGINYMSNLTKLFMIQKRLIRLIYNAEYHAETSTIFYNLKILNTQKINILLIAMHMHKNDNNALPDCIDHMFMANNYGMYTYTILAMQELFEFQNTKQTS